ERFSFYGMRGILVPFMTTQLLARDGSLATMPESEATGWFHLFVWAVYITPLFGAMVADYAWGKYRTIVSLSVVYCLGHLALALDATRLGLFLGLALISLGSGGIKGCVSAHVGDQFGAANSGLLPRVYIWFYFSINLGSCLAFLIVPKLLEVRGPHWGFGIGGIAMFIATVAFWMGRFRYAHIPPRGREFVKEVFSKEGLRVLGRLSLVYACVAIFWSLFDQTSSRWIKQAEKMDLDPFELGWQLNPAQYQFLNPLLVMLFIPACALFIYPWINRVFPLSPLRKMAIGFFLAIPSFLIPAWLEMRIEAGEAPSILWQWLAYVFITMAEVMISITGLEFSYTQAPPKMKSLMLGYWYFAVSMGNLFTSMVNFFIADRLPGVTYYLFFSACIAVTALAFIFIARGYRARTYLQDEAQV
ncbi:MAG: MFS transporter, partial [Verrucomicrobiales bacterium]